VADTNAVIRGLSGRSGWGDVLLFGAAGAALILCIVIIFAANDRDRAVADATFLSECHEAGCDATKCQFFLTAMSRANAGAAASRAILDSTASQQ
jgi:hypothetical protein